MRTKNSAPANTWPALALIVNAFVWGVSWIPLRHLEANGLHPAWATCLVFVAIAGCFGLLHRGILRAFALYPALLLLGLAAGFTNVGFNWAVAQGDVVRVVLLFYLMPVWSALLAWLLLGERPRAAALARIALALAGVAVVLKTPEVEWPVPASLTDWLAVAAGFSFALTNILLRRLRAAPGSMRALAMFIGCALVGGATALTGTALGQLPAPPPLDVAWWGWALALGIGVVCGNICLQYGASRLAASTTSVIMLSEVLFASASSVALGAASMEPRVWLGAVLIVLAALWSAFERPPKDQADNPPSHPKAIP